MFRLRAISEIVAALLIMLIAISIGVSIYLYVMSNILRYQQYMSQQLLSEEIKFRQSLTILYVLGNSTNNSIVVIVISCNWPVNLIAVYVNNTLAVDFLSLGRPKTIPPQSTVELQIPSPIPLNPNSIIEVKVVYEGGEVVSLGEVV